MAGPERLIHRLEQMAETGHDGKTAVRHSYGRSDLDKDP